MDILINLNALKNARVYGQFDKNVVRDYSVFFMY